MTWLWALVVTAQFGLIWRLQTLHDRREAERDLREASLLDRIQHPEVRHVQPSEPVDLTPSADAAEMAMVGLEVPDFVHVGNQE